MDDENTITISDDALMSAIDTITINTNNTAYSYSHNMSNYSIGAIGSSGSFLTSNGSNGTSWSNITTGSANPSSLNVKGDAEFEGYVKINGVSFAKALDDIQKRLAILVPDPAKLEHFTALKKAYEHYKTLEALCEIPKEENKE